MDFIKDLENNSILIVDNNIKNKVLDYLNDNSLLKQVKIMSFTEVKKSLLYDYTNEAINSVMNYKNVSYSVAKNYINNTYYLVDESYEDSKLDDLLKLKKYLDDSELLIKDNLFINLIRSKSNIYVYGFDYINKFNKYILDILSKYTKVTIIDKANNDYHHKVYELNTIEEEVIYVAEKISELIESGVPLNKIYIANYSNDYYFTMNKIFNMYNIPYYVRSETKLYDTVMGKYFIDNLNDNMDVYLHRIKNKFDCDNNEYSRRVFTKLANLVNTYYWASSYVDIKELIIEEMKNTTIPYNHYEEEITTVNIINNIFSDDEYVFLIGFNLGSIPPIKKDEDYINDSIKTSVMETSSELNEINKNTYLQVIKNIKNITITYKKVSPFQAYYSSFIIDDDYLVKEKVSINYSKYSNKINEMLYASSLDRLIKYNEKDKSLEDLSSNYDIPYMTYDSKYTMIDNNKIIEKLKTKPLSYSSISNYYKCPFKFYLSFMFRLDKYEQTLDTFIGSLFHKVLEDCITTDKNIDLVYDSFIEENKEKRIFTNKDLFFIEKLRSEVHFIVDSIKEQYKNSKHDLTKEWHEESLNFEKKDLDLNTKVDYILTGVIDKVLFVDDNAVIIDYKTGTSDTIDRELFEFGLTIQLPIYLYLLKNKFKDINIVGMYLQHILQGLIKRDKYNKNKTVEEINSTRLKLDGLTLSDSEKIELFDSSYDDSNVIKSLKLKKDGSFYYENRIMTYEEQDNLYNLIKNLLETSINDIADAKFDIKPLVIEKKSVDGCKFCKYKDICFVKKSDKNIVIINKNEGDEDE